MVRVVRRACTLTLACTITLAVIPLTSTCTVIPPFIKVAVFERREQDAESKKDEGEAASEEAGVNAAGFWSKLLKVRMAVLALLRTPRGCFRTGVFDLFRLTFSLYPALPFRSLSISPRHIPSLSLFHTVLLSCPSYATSPALVSCQNISYLIASVLPPLFSCYHLIDILTQTF